MRNYGRILTAVYSTPWAILPEKGRVLADVLTRKANGEDIPDDQVRAVAEAKREGKPRARPKGATVGVIPVYGTITQRADLFSEWSGGTSAELVGQWVDEFAADPAVDAIVMEFDSPGGSVYGIEELALKVAEATKRKPVIASVNSLAASAGYWVAAQASELVVTPNGEVGSIGVYVMHRDRSAALERAGERVTFVSAGELKTAGHSYGPLDEVSRAELQKGVDDYYQKFVAAVARGRKTSVATVRGGFGRGGVVRAEEAVRLGMADRVATFASVLGRFGLGAADLMRAADERPEPVALAGTRTPTAPAGKAADPDIELRRRKMRLAEINSTDHAAAGQQTATARHGSHLPPAVPAGVHAGPPGDGRTPADDWKTCLHESGHCVATIALGGRVMWATANPTRLADGQTAAGSMRDAGLDDYGKLVMLFAGMAAEGAAELTGKDRDDAARLDPYAHQRTHAREDARGILARNSAAVERLAAALRDRRVLSGEDVTRLVGPAR